MGQLQSAEVLPHTATVHTLNEIGIHTGINVGHLASPTLEDVLATQTIDAGGQIYRGVGDLRRVAWIDFHQITKGPDWINEELATTYVALRERARVKDDFLCAGVIASSILHARMRRDPDYSLSKADKNHIERFSPDAQITALPAYMQAWLPGFLRLDRPHPPKLAARTDTIRMLASLGQ